MTTPAVGSLHRALVSLTVAWGAFAFGAVYPWAYWPLIAGCGIVAAAGYWLRDSEPPARSLVILGLLLAAAVWLQLLPLARSLLRMISPSTPVALSQLNALFAATDGAHPLSINPPATRLGVVFLLAMLALFYGSTRIFSAYGTRWFARHLVVIGTVLALVGVIQKSVFHEYIYGFWLPYEGRDPFGPFVNKNHFAGWMLLALPVCLALVAARVGSAMRHVGADWHSRAVWIGSHESSRLILLALSCAVMLLSLMLTMSRSGISSVSLCMIAIGVVATYRLRTWSRRSAVVLYLLFIGFVVVAWVGLDILGARFGSADWTSMNRREGAWQDAIDVGRRFPLVGTGFNTYGTSMLLYQRHDTDFHYGEAHNDYLQLFAEGGLLLVVPAVLLVTIFVVEVRRRFREPQISNTSWWLRAGAVTGLVAMALQETVEFSLQIPGDAALFAVLAGLAVHRPPIRRD